MRVSATAASLIVASVTATDTVLRGRSLHTLKEDTASVEGFTNAFCTASFCTAPENEFEGASLVGLIVGFTVTFCAMLFAVIVIIRDEIKRHKDYAIQLEKDRADLMSKHGATQKDLDDYDQAFMTKENAKKKTAAELEQERLELMAKN